MLGLDRLKEKVPWPDRVPPTNMASGFSLTPEDIPAQLALRGIRILDKAAAPLLRVED